MTPLFAFFFFSLYPLPPLLSFPSIGTYVIMLSQSTGCQLDKLFNFTGSQLIDVKNIENAMFY